MGKYVRHQLDANAKEIKAALEAVGATVDHRCPLDWLVGHRNRNYLLEVKTAKGKLRASQERFFAAWKGQKALVRTVEEALAVLGVQP